MPSLYKGHDNLIFYHSYFSTYTSRVSTFRWISKQRKTICFGKIMSIKLLSKAGDTSSVLGCRETIMLSISPFLFIYNQITFTFFLFKFFLDSYYSIFFLSMPISSVAPANVLLRDIGIKVVQMIETYIQ